MAEPREMRLRDVRREGTARFLRQLRELRDQAGLGCAELAARAHYPFDVIKAAECGPSLPDLPVLSAYVRGCGGTMAEWEERWRAVTGSPATPLLTARAAGCSEAADAGARVGAASAAADGHDPDRVMAALNRVADGMAAAASSPSPSSSSSGAAGGAMADAALSDSAAFDEAAFEALAADTITPAVPDQAPVVPAARPSHAQDRVPAARRADSMAPAATSAAAMATGAAQIRSPGRAGLSRVALAVLIAVGLLLLATLIAVVA